MPAAPAATARPGNVLFRSQQDFLIVGVTAHMFRVGGNGGIGTAFHAFGPIASKLTVQLQGSPLTLPDTKRA